jgi:flavodoxin
MGTLVVYESMYGNTRAIAEAIAGGIGPAAEVEIVEVSQAPQELPPGVDLVVVGAPTHAHGLSRPQSRQSAAQHGPIVSRGIGVREWIEGLTPSAGVRAAAFDTRFAKARWITGSAAITIRKMVRRRGFAGDVPTESFFVDHSLGPLHDGELRRAREWGAGLRERRTAAV